MVKNRNATVIEGSLDKNEYPSTLGYIQTYMLPTFRKTLHTYICYTLLKNNHPVFKYKDQTLYMRQMNKNERLIYFILLLLEFVLCV